MSSQTPHASLPSAGTNSGGGATKWIVLVILFAALVTAGLFWKPGGTGFKTRIVRLWNPDYGKIRPFVHYFPSPVVNEHDVHSDAILSLRVWIVNGAKLDPKSFPGATTSLTDAKGESIPLAIKPFSKTQMLLRPGARLKTGTTYTFKVADLKTVEGVTLPEFNGTFNTAIPPDPDLHFQKVALPNTSGYGFTATVMGPDHKLYAGTDEGLIFRYPVNADGTLGDPQKITALQDANKPENGGLRLLIGFCFDPKATADNPIIWVTHGYYAFTKAPDFSGKVTRMSGPNLENVQDVVIHLPRSYNDHCCNQPNFGPDGALYFPQGASNASGAPDQQWHMRHEHLLTAAMLRLDVTKVTPGQPIDVKTVEEGGPYDPRLPGAPLTVYCYGIRNAYDCVWTSKGQLYVPTNGADAGGNAPAGPPGSGIPALNNITLAEDDWLFHVTPGVYYGHPNPWYGHYVLNGGNMNGGLGFAEVNDYPLGTKPDPQWQPACFDFGPHVSANGVIEYMSDTFNGKLKHTLMVCRYNAGSDIIILRLNDKGDVASTEVGVPGLTNLNAPLDITEDQTNGDLYVSEYGAHCITLMRPTATYIPSDDDGPAAPHIVPGSETKPMGN